MGLLIEGQWSDQWYDTENNKGQFIRSESKFRNWISRDGETGYRAEKDRYHLYVSLACPWAHRALIMRELKGLQDLISVSVVNPLMHEMGWTFGNDFPGATGDHLYAKEYLHQIYTQSEPLCSSRVTVPVLWDKKQKVIVNNESSDIIRMFNSVFDHLDATAGDFYPAELQTEIDSVNEFVYDSVNNGVYRAGFATSQEAYEQAVKGVFSALETLENRLSQQRYLLGDRFTEADIRLFTTLIRFDPVYVTHFKCDLKRIADYPSLSGYLREIYQMEGVSGTVDMAHIRHHYYRSHTTINPTGVISIGPEFDLDRPHGRGEL
jgi:putative glutathione S-transferase